MPLQLPRQRQRAGRVVDEDRRAVGDLAQRVGRDHVFPGWILPRAFHEVGLHASRVAFDRSGASSNARDQALGGQHLEVAMDGYRRDRILASQLADRRTAVPANVSENLNSSQLWRRLIDHQTRSTNSRFLISNRSGRKASIACTRWRANRFKASSPFCAVARNGLPITPVSVNSPWSIGKLKYW